MTAKDKLPKDHKLAKESKSMSTGAAKSGIEQYDRIVLHGAHLIKVIASDASETIAEYENGAQRIFSTFDLASYRELDAFPSGAAFHRQTKNGVENLFIEQLNPDTYIVEVIEADGNSVTKTISHADLMAWHSGGDKVDPNIKLVPGTHLYVPKTTVPVALPIDPLVKELDDYLESEANNEHPFEAELKEHIEQLQAEPEALQFGQALIDALRAQNEQLESMIVTARENALSERCALIAEMEETEGKNQTLVDDLMKQLRQSKDDLLNQDAIHTTQMLAAYERIQRLEAKSATFTPTRKEVCTLSHGIGVTEKRRVSDVELADSLSQGWTILNMTITSVEEAWRYVTLVRDLPAAPAPKVAATDAAIYSVPVTPAVRQPVQRPPMPANQTILNQPVSRALTNNGPKPGETKRIPSLADLQARREKDSEEIGEIMQRGLDAQEALRRQFAQSPSPFNPVGAQ